VTEGIPNAEKIVDLMVGLAERFPGQPVAVIDEGGELKVGVLSLCDPAPDDWFYNPVPLVSLAEKEPADLLK
jgi:hypothetical protein